MKRIIARMIVLVTVLAAVGTSWAGTVRTLPDIGTAASSTRAPQARSSNIVERLERAGNFSILLAALETAQLEDTVATGGPFTVFAPTDEAFADLLQQIHVTAPELLANPDLASILLYHVVSGNYRAGQLLKASAVSTLSDAKPVLIVLEGTSVLVNRAKVTRANLAARNGVIHVIDKVLLPPAEPVTIANVADVLRLDGRFSILLEALARTGLDDALAAPGPFTVFAPTDEAFGALLAMLNVTPEQLLDDPNLSNILLYHVLGERKGLVQLLTARNAGTLQSGTVSVRLGRDGVYVNDARVVNPNINAPNGVIHTIDKVLLP